MSLTFADIASARERLVGHLTPSRLVPASSLTRHAGAPIFLKMESDQPTGSFKPRGALYALMARMAKVSVREVVASSTGNHGAAVAYAARTLGLPATIYLPDNPNPVKRARIATLGATIVEIGCDLPEAAVHAAEHGRQDGVYFLDDASDPNVLAGPGTIACELFEQQPAIRTIYVPVGDTALIRGFAVAARHLCPGVRIVGVQAERAPSYYLSWKAGEPVGTETCDTIADGLATRTPRAENVAGICELVDEMRLVSEEQMLGAIRWLLLEERVVAEPAAAAATAALLAEAPGAHSEPVALLVTGANIPESVLRRALCA
jgi:threonine dehydratase